MATYRITNMDENIGKFVCGRMQNEQKKTKIMKRSSLIIFMVKFLTCNIFVFCKNLLCCLRSSCLHNDVNNSIKWKKTQIVQLIYSPKITVCDLVFVFFIGTSLCVHP